MSRNIKRLAKEFSRLLKEEIGEDRFSDLVAENEILKDEVACVSHEYCDANMVMLEAYESIHKLESHVINDMEEMSAAWDLAKENDFYKSEL